MSALLAALALVGAASAAPTPASAPSPAPAEKPAAKVLRKAPELAGEKAEFKTSDGWTLGGRYMPAREGELTFVLVHDQKGRHQDWRRLAVAMAARGIGYLAFDLRGHGLSQRPPEGQPTDWRQFKADRAQNDWDNMREDVAAAMAFLKSKGVAEDRIGLGGGDVGGSVALKYAALHPEVPMLFLLSPGMSYRNVATVNAIRSYKNRPILLIAADTDKYSKEAEILAMFARGTAGQENVLYARVRRGHGTQLLLVKGVVERILSWIDSPIQAQGLMNPDGSDPDAEAAGTEPESPDGLPSEKQMDRRLGAPDAGNY